MNLQNSLREALSAEIYRMLYLLDVLYLYYRPAIYQIYSLELA